jgi:hypothetical protein
VDRLLFRKVDFDAGGVNHHALPDAANQMHLYSLTLPVIACLVAKRRDVKRATQLAVDADQQIAIEGGGDAQDIIIGRD